VTARPYVARGPKPARWVWLSDRAIMARPSAELVVPMKFRHQVVIVELVRPKDVPAYVARRLGLVKR